MKITRIDYNGGYLWVDNTATHADKGSWVIEMHNPIVKSVCKVTGRHLLKQGGYNDKLIVAQTNLSIGNVPYVEFEQNVEVSLINSYKKVVGEQLNHHELKLIKWLAAQSKGRYSDDDIEAAIHNAQSASNLHTEDDVLISRKFLEQYFKSLNQPPIEIEIQTKQVCGDMSCLRMSLNGEDSTCCGDSIITVPVTYTRDGKTYLKVKQ